MIVRFARPFALEGVEHELPPGHYRIMTEEEQIEGLSFMAYRRISTSIAVPTAWQQPISARTDRFASVEIVRIAPADLARALARDAAG